MMTQYCVNPIVDLRGLPPGAQIQEFHFRCSEAERRPEDAKMVRFKFGPGIYNIICQRDIFYLAG